ncbi:NADHypothetical protein adrenodoxin oxidoreductase [Nesidiocoris tenuis]|uniref:NADPH:adrenodoxin oxidoreductase, mitochondrial n=1 Tax=Nesidiocoris tenuis TaxID=355587 RepID=A0ABN7AX15_9HEMI|nr:NADHypothetical protein adrenodoxin oxidoreductase [Nesidiocoris tenuis]
MLTKPHLFISLAKCSPGSLRLSHNFSTAGSESMKRICIVGSGPAGFYFAQNIFKKLPNVAVDVYEKLPVPFGLVRYGVAPDHPEVKNVINTFEKVASNKNFRFVGNVTLGRDLTFADLKNAYDSVVLAYGCSHDKELGIPGERVPKVLSARRFVGWYNGLPEDRDLQVDLDCESVVILGQGNVAVDVARILLSPIDMLKGTDITEYSLEALAASRVKTVHLAGRRGPLQAAFTIKEFREMTKLPDVQTILDSSHFEGVEQLVPKLPRARKRLTELLLSTSKQKQSGYRSFKPTFLHKPVEILSSGTALESVRFELNSIDQEKGTVKGRGQFEKIDCGLVLRSIGYQGTCPDPDIPFDSTRGVVLKEDGICSTGWIHTGPTGVILSTMSDAYEQSNLLVEDLQKNNSPSRKPGFADIQSKLRSKGVVTVDFDGWRKIDSVEVERGATKGKPREKIVSIDKMLEIGGKT